MNLFQFFVVENFLVVGLPQQKRIFDSFYEDRFYELYEPFLEAPLVHPFETKRQSPSEIAPPSSRTIIRPNLRQYKFIRNGDGKRCQCSEKKAWKKHWTSYDSNNGTGDHEELK